MRGTDGGGSFGVIFISLKELIYKASEKVFMKKP